MRTAGHSQRQTDPRCFLRRGRRAAPAAPRGGIQIRASASVLGTSTSMPLRTAAHSPAPPRVEKEEEASAASEARAVSCAYSARCSSLDAAAARGCAFQRGFRVGGAGGRVGGCGRWVAGESGGRADRAQARTGAGRGLRSRRRGRGRRGGGATPARGERAGGQRLCSLGQKMRAGVWGEVAATVWLGAPPCWPAARGLRCDGRASGRSDGETPLAAIALRMLFQ